MEIESLEIGWLGIGWFEIGRLTAQSACEMEVEARKRGTVDAIELFDIVMLSAWLWLSDVGVRQSRAGSPAPVFTCFK